MVVLMTYIIINLDTKRKGEADKYTLQTCNPRKAMRIELMLPRTPSGSYGIWVA